MTSTERPAGKTAAQRVDHDLEAAIPYLITRAGARMGGAFSKALKPYGLSLSEWRVCASLNHAPHQSLSELVAHSSVDMSALSRIVDGLVEAGLLVRERSSTDGRAIRISLSETGIELTQLIIPLAQRYEEVALSDFAPAEVKVLRTLLRRLYANAAPLVDGPA